MSSDGRWTRRTHCDAVDCSLIGETVILAEHKSSPLCRGAYTRRERQVVLEVIQVSGKDIDVRYHLVNEAPRARRDFVRRKKERL